MPEKERKDGTCFAYMLRCADGSLYSGWTNDLARRVKAHNTGSGARYTRSRRPVTLAWAQGFPSRHEAMVREAQLKRMTRARKEALIRSGTASGDQPSDEE